MSDWFDRPLYADIEEEARATWLAERPDPDGPSAAELAGDDFDDWCWWREQQRPDPWGDGPVHHPTRFDLPVSAEPPF